MTESIGPYALAIERFWWFAFWLLSAVFVTVMAVLAYAAVHRNRTPRPTERSIGRAVGGAVAATALILIVYMVFDLATSRAVAAPRNPVDPLFIRVTGHQWWWEIEYEDSVASRRLITANELHIPVDRDVRIMTRTADVIHSLWMPNLHGKRDLVPADTGFLWVRADRTGRFTGRCAEFCGHQHAHMALDVIVHTRRSFENWYERQLLPAEPPRDSLQLAGQEVFLARACVMCHTIRGTLSGGRTAPDLTHFASRATIAAGTRPNTRGHLAGWIIDPQRIKPGVRMPPNQLTGVELHALLAYLESLQ